MPLVPLASGLLLCLGLSGCLSQDPPLNLPDARVISFDGNAAVPPDCTQIAEPSHLGDPDRLPHPTIPFGCATYANLAAELARPEDAVSPKPYAGERAADAALGASAVRALENGKVTPLTSGNTMSSPEN
ncbi:hypothetical protein CY652_06110 [Burkholderia sp. WAC0059]|nr:hypothetical protein CY652_06110 [Burkholderia sp. WAC0059]